MKTVQVHARATRTGDDVVVTFAEGSGTITTKGKMIDLDLGELTMPAEVWEFFQAAMMMMHRSQTEDYHFETGLHYEQPDDGKYPDQRHLQIDPWYETGEMALRHPEETEVARAVKDNCPKCGANVYQVEPLDSAKP